LGFNVNSAAAGFTHAVPSKPHNSIGRAAPILILQRREAVFLLEAVAMIAWSDASAAASGPSSIGEGKRYHNDENAKPHDHYQNAVGGHLKHDVRLALLSLCADRLGKVDLLRRSAPER
jgi:hypothetical protein